MPSVSPRAELGARSAARYPVSSAAIRARSAVAAE